MKSIISSLILLFLFVGNVSAGDAICTVVNGVKTCPVCAVDGNGAIDMTVQENKHNGAAKCTIDNAVRGFTLYKLGLCRSLPNTANPTTDWETKCDFILDKPTGQFVESRIGTPFNIPGIDLSAIQETTYTHYTLLMSNQFKTKEKYTFKHRMAGQTSDGTICYTVDGFQYKQTQIPNRASLSVECVDSEQQISNYGHMVFNATYLGSSTPRLQAPSGTNVYLMADKTTLATMNLAQLTSDANYIAAVFYPSSSNVISPDTKSIDFSFLHTQAGQIEFHTNMSECLLGNRPANTEACVASMRGIGFDFKVTVN